MNALQNDTQWKITMKTMAIREKGFSWCYTFSTVQLWWSDPKSPVDAIFGASYIIAIVNEPISVSLAKNSHDSP